jgi:hypothetical protein
MLLLSFYDLPKVAAMCVTLELDLKPVNVDHAEAEIYPDAATVPVSEPVPDEARVQCSLAHA